MDRWNAALKTSVFVGIALVLCSTPPASGAGQYKRRHRGPVIRMTKGDFDGALQRLEKLQKEQPDDPETFYCLALAHANLGHTEKATECVRKAVDAGLPFGRFLARPLSLARPLLESEQFRKLAEQKDVELVHGPMLSDVTDTSAEFWVRTAHDVPVWVLVGRNRNMQSPFRSVPVKADSGRGFTTVARVEGLEPGTRYYYRLVLKGEEHPGQWSFRTYPEAGWPAEFTVGFGGGAGYTPWHERMWNTIAARSPRAFLFLGDNVYIDYPKDRDVQRHTYYRRQSRPEFRSFVASSSIYAIWDDHDFCTNDSGGGPKIDEPAWKLPVWRVFTRQWNNPYYAGGQDRPGCWFDFSIGDVDFFMLDGRYYRTSSGVEHPSMLGPAQKEWLFGKLQASDATFKVLASPVPWAYGSKPGSNDPWQGYREEREEIFSFIQENGIEGVFLISADRHRSDVWRIEREDGYPLWEFESSKLTNVHTHGKMKGALYSYNDKCSFGLLSFDTTLSDPRVTYKIVNIDGKVVHTLTLTRSRLTGGGS